TSSSAPPRLVGAFRISRLNPLIRTIPWHAECSYLGPIRVRRLGVGRIGASIYDLASYGCDPPRTDRLDCPGRSAARHPVSRPAPAPPRPVPHPPAQARGLPHPHTTARLAALAH